MNALRALLGLFILVIGYNAFATCLDDCKADYNDCLSTVTTENDCLNERRTNCLDPCQEKYGHSYDECLLRYCSPLGAANNAVWGPECRKQAKEGAKSCLDDKKVCDQACSP